MQIRFVGLDQCYYLALIVQFKVMHYIMITKEKCLSCVTLDRKVPVRLPLWSLRCGHIPVVPNWLIKGLVMCTIYTILIEPTAMDIILGNFELIMYHYEHDLL